MAGQLSHNNQMLVRALPNADLVSDLQRLRSLNPLSIDLHFPPCNGLGCQ